MMLRGVGVLAVLAALFTLGVGLASGVGEPTVGTQTFTNVVTYTIPTVTQTVTVSETPPPPPPPQTVTRTSMGLGFAGISYPIWNTSRSLTFDFNEMQALGAKY